MFKGHLAASYYCHHQKWGEAANPNQNLSFYQAQAPPYRLSTRQCNCLTTFHWHPVAHEVSPLCPQMESVCSTLSCWQHDLLSVWHMGVLSEVDRCQHQRALIVNSSICSVSVGAESQEKLRISKERGGWSQHKFLQHYWVKPILTFWLHLHW